MIIGLRRGTVKLVEHQEGWKEAGTKCIELLSSILGESAVAIEHVGSTAIPGIHAKPILDIVVGVRSLDDAMKYKDELALHKIIFRGEDNPYQNASHPLRPLGWRSMAELHSLQGLSLFKSRSSKGL